MRKWTVRRAFRRVVKSIVHLKRADPMYCPLSYDEFKQERERLFQIGRTAQLAKKMVASAVGEGSQQYEGRADINNMLQQIKIPAKSAQSYAKMVKYAMRTSDDDEIETAEPTVTLSKLEQVVAAAEVCACIMLYYAQMNTVSLPPTFSLANCSALGSGDSRLPSPRRG